MSFNQLPNWNGQTSAGEYPMVEFLDESALLRSHTKSSSCSDTLARTTGGEGKSQESDANSYTCEMLQLTGDEFRRKVAETRERRRQEYETMMAKQSALLQSRQEPMAASLALAGSQASGSTDRESLNGTHIYQQSQSMKQSQTKSPFSLPRSAFANDVDFVTDALARFCVGDNDIIDLSTMTWRPRVVAADSSPTSTPACASR